MIRSSFKTGQVIESALKRSQMLAISRFGLSTVDLLKLLDNSVVSVAQKYFEKEKEGYYGSRAVLATTNGKYGAGTGSYDSQTQYLTITMSPVASANDIGKVVTFFDNTTTPARFFSGVIDEYIAGSPTKYKLSLFYPIPDLSGVVYVTVGDWLLTGDVISITDGNQIFSPENLNLYDLTNNHVINVVDYKEFDRRRFMTMYNTSESRWAKFTSGAIEIASGSGASALGTVLISAYWIPPKSTSLGHAVYISDKRISEVEESLVNKLLSIKAGQLVGVENPIQGELASIRLRDEKTITDSDKVR